MTKQKLAIDQFVGGSAWMGRLRKRIQQIANFNYGVLITGPSGTGKELVARSIHGAGPRSEKPFIPVNCAAVPAGLFSSQLFGHTKGAFTGAQYASLGCFRAADGGTIFLDEIGELDLDCQAKLLRVLQEKKVTPVGGHDDISVNVRTVAATNRDLGEEVRAGRFRLDLFYRLNVLSVETLGLADRIEDIEPLAKHFLAKTSVECGLPLKQLTPESLALLQSYDWPGNVRELENFIERAVVLTEGDEIVAEAFPEILQKHISRESPLPGGYLPPRHPLMPNSATSSSEPILRSAPHRPESPPLTSSSYPAHLVEGVNADPGEWLTLADLERLHIQKTLRETFYNQSAAARMLGVDRKLLARKIKRYGIHVPSRDGEQRPR